MTYTHEPAIDLTMRVYEADLDAELHDVRGQRAFMPEMYHHTDYAAAQALGAQIKGEGAWGITYDSMRQPGGQCVGIFRPKALSNCRQTKHLAYSWDGSRIAHVVELKLLY